MNNPLNKIFYSPPPRNWEQIIECVEDYLQTSIETITEKGYPEIKLFTSPTDLEDYIYETLLEQLEPHHLGHILQYIDHQKVIEAWKLTGEIRELLCPDKRKIIIHIIK